MEYVDFRTEDTAIPHILASKDKVLENLKRINESEPPSVNEVEVPKVRNRKKTEIEDLN